MKYLIKTIFLISNLMILFLVAACGRLPINLNKEVNTAESKLKTSMQVQNVEAAKEAIEEGANVNKFSDRILWEHTDRGHLENNPTRIAIFTGCYDVAKILLENGSDANYEDVDGVSLLQAVSNKDEQFIKTLVDNGADINKICKNEQTVLEYSIANQKWDAVEVLLGYNPQIREETINILLRVCKDNTDEIWRGFNEIRELLKLTELTDSELQNLFSNSNINNLLDLEWVTAFGLPEDVLKGLEEFPEYNEEQLCKCAALYGNTDVLKQLIDINLNSNSIELWEQSLSIAAEYDNVKTVDFILTQEENIDIKNAAQIAAQNNSKGVMDKLLKFGLNSNEPINGDTLLKTACFYGNLPIVKDLVENGANVNGANNGEPLSVAARKGYKEIVQYLIENGANVNGNNTYSDGSGGESVLMYAIRGGQLECMKLLIENGADVHYSYSSDSGCDSVIDSAKRGGSERIYQYLLEIS